MDKVIERRAASDECHNPREMTDMFPTSGCLKEKLQVQPSSSPLPNILRGDTAGSGLVGRFCEAGTGRILLKFRYFGAIQPDRVMTLHDNGQ